jgi:hypothetical protein
LSHWRQSREILPPTPHASNVIFCSEYSGNSSQSR